MQGHGEEDLPLRLHHWADHPNDSGFTFGCDPMGFEQFAQLF